MKRWLRRIRGAIGMGMVWGFAWFAAGMVLLLIVGPDAADVPFPIGFGFLGFLAGVTFSGIVGIVARRRRFDELSLPRFSAWGGLGGLLFSGLFVPIAGLAPGVLAVLAPIFTAAGAGCAALALTVARRAEDFELIEAGVDPADLAEIRESGSRERLGDGP